jgi:hypothetical protein
LRDRLCATCQKRFEAQTGYASKHGNRIARLSLHPEGIAPRILNLPEWRSHLLARLRRQIDLTADPVLGELLEELSAYPLPGGARGGAEMPAEPVVPIRLATPQGTLAFISTVASGGNAIFGFPPGGALFVFALPRK